MGRWVTSKGRRIYIPDEGEENPYQSKKENKEAEESPSVVRFFALPLG